MRPSFHPRLINGAFGDPGLFIPFLFQKRAILFDLGDIHALAAKDILKISHVFVSHTHMDHFIGFDRLLRLFLGREKSLYLYGPAGISHNVEGKLAGYAWNLVENFSYRLSLNLTEVHPKYTRTSVYHCQDRFRPNSETVQRPFNEVLYEEPSLAVSTVILDHGISCLGFAIEERFHVNINKDAVLALGLETGPWLQEFKQALYHRRPPDSEFEVKPDKHHPDPRRFSLGELAERIARIAPGQKITYITDMAYNPSNVKRMVPLVQDSDHLFIEAAFLEKDRAIAAAKKHLTAWQAGRLAALARAKQFTLFHFSPRYLGQAHLLQEEALRAYETAGNGTAAIA
ncbi:MAG: ribonuclease Z [Desulfobacterales bacterium]|nr:MAG: ribonuclease Z [Desulfobacterales bacterium]